MMQIFEICYRKSDIISQVGPMRKWSVVTVVSNQNNGSDHLRQGRIYRQKYIYSTNGLKMYYTANAKDFDVIKKVRGVWGSHLKFEKLM